MSSAEIFTRHAEITVIQQFNHFVQYNAQFVLQIKQGKRETIQFQIQLSLQLPYGPRQAKKCLQHAQNSQIQIIQCMRKVPYGPVFLHM